MIATYITKVSRMISQTHSLSGLKGHPTKAQGGALGQQTGKNISPVRAE